MSKYSSDDNRSMQLNPNNERYYSSRGGAVYDDGDDASDEYYEKMAAYAAQDRIIPPSMQGDMYRYAMGEPCRNVAWKRREKFLLDQRASVPPKILWLTFPSGMRLARVIGNSLVSNLPRNSWSGS